MTRILIVDDEPGITLTLKKGLEINGFEVHTFNDPLIALSNFKVIAMRYYLSMSKCQP